MVLKWGRFGIVSQVFDCDATRDAEPNPAPRRCEWNSLEQVNKRGIEACELCGKPMQMKLGGLDRSSGALVLLSAATSQDREERCAAPRAVPLDEKCPVDGAQLVRRFGRFGGSSHVRIIRSANTSSRSRQVLRAHVPVAKVNWWLRSPSAAKCFMVALRIRIAIGFTGTSRLRKLAQTATRPSCSRRPRRSKVRFVIARWKTVVTTRTRRLRLKSQ